MTTGLVLGTTIFYILLILVLNLFVDMVYAWLDPAREVPLMPGTLPVKTPF